MIPDSMRDLMSVGQVMTRDPIVIRPDEEASVAMKMMAERGIHRIPVVDNNTLIGIVSREDLVRAMELCFQRDSSKDIQPLRT